MTEVVTVTTFRLKNNLNKGIKQNKTPQTWRSDPSDLWGGTAWLVLVSLSLDGGTSGDQKSGPQTSTAEPWLVSMTITKL